MQEIYRKTDILLVFCQNPEVRQIGDSHISKFFLPAEEKNYYLEYDGYWLLQCKDQQEVIDL